MFWNKKCTNTMTVQQKPGNYAIGYRSIENYIKLEKYKIVDGILLAYDPNENCIGVFNRWDYIKLL